jgi:hypothetical protein
MEDYEETIALPAIQLTIGASFEQWQKYNDMRFVVKCLTKWKTKMIT